jgi:hypothetical protein
MQILTVIRKRYEKFTLSAGKKSHSLKSKADEKKLYT